MKNESDLTKRVVPEDSILGFYGLSALLDQEFFDTNSQPVGSQIHVYKINENFCVRYSDMECTVVKGNKYHEKLNEYFHKD